MHQIEHPARIFVANSICSADVLTQVKTICSPKERGEIHAKRTHSR